MKILFVIHYTWVLDGLHEWNVVTENIIIIMIGAYKLDMTINIYSL